jgi:F-box and leucine-rich repeat protein 2/20
VRVRPAGMRREGEKLDCTVRADGVGIGVLPLDLLGHVLDHLREPRDRKACCLVNRAFKRAEAAHHRALQVLRREPLPLLLRAFPALERLDDTLLSATVAGVGGGLAGHRQIRHLR